MKSPLYCRSLKRVKKRPAPAFEELPGHKPSRDSPRGSGMHLQSGGGPCCEGNRYCAWLKKNPACWYGHCQLNAHICAWCGKKEMSGAGQGWKMGQLIQSMGPVCVKIHILAQRATNPVVRWFNFFLSLQFFYHTCICIVVHAVNCLCRLKKKHLMEIRNIRFFLGPI